MGKKKTKVNEATEAVVTTEAVATAPTEPKPRRKKTNAADADVQAEVPPTPEVEPAPPTATLEDLATGYLTHLEETGKSQGTVFSYRLELAVALDELGATTPVRELTAERVEAFFATDRVTKTRAGVLKARVSVEKTKRVLRQAIEWGVERGIVEMPVASAS
jgi:hypothetical protein